jgi:hypothetical protein
MPIAHLNLQPGEYVVLTQSYLGLPAASVGIVTERRSPRWHRYLVYFGESLPRGPSLKRC